MLRKIAVVLNEGIKPRERRREGERERSSHHNYLYLSSCQGHMLKAYAQAPKALIIT
jgi:hypothetical protein